MPFTQSGTTQFHQGRTPEAVIFAGVLTTIGIKLQQVGIHAKQRGHHQDAAITILNIRRMDDGVEQQALGID
jgi:hypothetical protein